MAKIKKDSIEAEALAIVTNEKAAWEKATVWVSDRVSFDIRKLISKCRKNYWGVFDNPIDTQTGREKTFIPLTESLVESVVKNIDLDAKDMNYRSDIPGMSDSVHIVRQINNDYLYNTYFGSDLDIFERVGAIDGTAVWKTIVEDGVPKRRLVDLMNFYIDPIAESIFTTPAVIERCVLSEKEFMSYDGWINKDLALRESNLHKNDQYLTNDNGETKMIEVFERWGLMPKYLITGNKDDDELIEGHIVCTKSNVHLIERNMKGIKPYEEWKFREVPGRWYGRGVAEMLMAMQIYLNTIVNIRINRSYLSQMGLFKIRRGANITPQMLSRLAVNGAIEVNSQDDIEQFVMQEASQASYTDEQNIWGWSQRLTSAYEIATGERLPSGTTATVGAIQNTAAQSQFALIKEGLGQFLQRWENRHVLPNLKCSVGDIITLSDMKEEEFAAIVSDTAKNIVIKNAKGGMYSDYNQALRDFQDISSRLMRGKTLHVKVDKEIPLSKFNVKVYVTNEDMDKGVLMNNLIQALSFAPQYAEPIIKEVFDLMGIKMPTAMNKPQIAQTPQGGMSEGMTPEMATQFKKPVAKGQVAGLQEARTF
jgi:hypothetical protein